MTTFQSLLVGWMFSLAISATVRALPPPQSEGLQAQRSVVVKLRIHRPRQPDETAAGFFVGKDQQSAYFITAYHALGPNSQGVSARSVQLQFYNSPQNFDALIFDNFDEGLDLGVVRTSVGNLPRGLSRMGRKDVAPDVPIHIIGHPSAGDWSVWSGSVQNEFASSGDVHHFSTNRDESLAGGYSGGAVFDADGNFLGIHISTTTSYGIAAKSSEIVTQLTAWRVPSNNLTTPVDNDVGPFPHGPFPQSSPSPDQDAIKKVLDLYSDAFSHKDKNALWKVWPSPPAKTRHAIEGYFGIASSITRKLQQLDYKIAPDHGSAQVTGQYSEEFTPKNGNIQRSSGSIAFQLEKKNEVWVIISVD